MGRTKKTATPEADAPIDPTTGDAPPTIPHSAIHHVALGRLVRAPENVRQDHDDAELDELAADILGHGLLQSLIGYDRDETGRLGFANELAENGIAWRDFDEDDAAVTDSLTFIVGGGRRLAALQRLVGAGALDESYRIPVLIRPREEAIELSLAENLARKDMNPVDQYRGFKTLIDRSGGAIGPADVARRFGYSLDLVRQRMRLADLADEILAALEAGAMTIDAAMAYATTQDLEVQRRVFKGQEKVTWKPHDPDTIRREIRGGTFAETAGLVRYIGIDAYEQAGGRFEDSLFAVLADQPGSRRLIDTALVRQLARDKAAPKLPDLARKAGYQDVLLSLETDAYGAFKRPTAPRGFGAMATDYYGFDREALKKALATAAKQEVPIVGIAGIDRDGKLVMADGVVYAPKAKIDELKPKPRNNGYRQETPEERAKRERDFGIRYRASKLAADLLVGGLPADRIRWSDYRGASPGHMEAHGQGFTVELSIFVTKAELEAAQPEAERQYDEEKSGAAAEREAEEKATADRRARLIAEPPAVVSIDQAPYDFFRQEDGSYADSKPIAGEEPDGQFGFETLEQLLDHANTFESELRTWSSIEAFDNDPQPGTCRICRCTEVSACFPPCSWADETQTLCDNPDCLAAAAAGPVGDGVTDDTAAIQAMVDEAAEPEAEAA